MLEKYMYEISEFLVKNNKPITINNIAKYSLSEKDFVKSEQDWRMRIKSCEISIRR